MSGLIRIKVTFCPLATSGPIFAHLPSGCGIFAVLKNRCGAFLPGSFMEMKRPCIY